MYNCTSLDIMGSFGTWPQLTVKYTLATRLRSANTKMNKNPVSSVLDGNKNSAEAARGKSALLKFSELDHVRLGRQKELWRTTLGKTKRSPFIWGLGLTDPPGPGQRLFQQLHDSFWRAAKSGNCDELTLLEGGPGSALFNEFSSTEFALLEVAICSYGIELTSHGEPPADESDLLAAPLTSQLLHVEVPIWQAVAAELNSNESDSESNIEAECEPLALVVRRMETLISECLDADGWPEACVIADTGLLMASWCRCCELLQQVQYKIDSQTQLMLDGLCLQLIRLSRRDGSLLLGGVGGGLNCNAFRKSLLRNCAEKIGVRSEQSMRSYISELQTATSTISEWGQVGALQKSWKLGGNKIAFAFDEQKIRLDLSNGESLVVGDCTPQLIVDGVAESVNSEIGVSGFLRFDGGDYIELEVEYEHVTLQRQIVFLAEDNLLIVNDVVTAAKLCRIDYAATYPIGSGIELVRETETNEFYLKSGSDYCLVLPLAMPEWKAEKTEAHVDPADHQFTVSVKQRGPTAGLAYPLVFDLNRKRSTQPRTWRQLTVAENMKIVGNDIAAAFRVQIGSEQWLFYRSIGETGNRTFLGENYADEFFIGKMNSDGEFESLLEIE